MAADAGDMGANLQIALKGESTEQRQRRLVSVHGGTRMRTVAEFRKARRRIWLIAGLWAALLGANVLFVPSPWRIVCAALLLVMAPGVTGDLFKSYEKYAEEWKLGNPKQPTDGSEPDNRV
jgi:hypothetical protein